MSASRMVDSRWAMTKLVRPFISSAMAFWIRTSVWTSTLLVASSRIRISGSEAMARAMVMSWRSPWEMFSAPLLSTMS